MTSQTGDQSQGWRWLVLVAAFMAMFLNSSLSCHVGVLNMAILDTFASDFVATCWLVSFYSSLFALAAPLGSLVIDLTNCRKCVLASGVITLAGYIISSYAASFPVLFVALSLAGIGHALAQTGSILVLTYNFPDNVAVVNGICMAGSGLGSFVHPMMLQALIDAYGLRGALLLIAAISFNACVAAMFFRQTKYENQKVFTSDDHPHKSFITSVSEQLSVFKDPVFSTFILGVFCFAMSMHAILVYLPEFSISVVGLDQQQASIGASFFGMGSVLSRLFAGFAASDKRIGELLLFIGMNCLASVLCFASTAVLINFVSVVAFTAVIGLYTGGITSLVTPIVVEIVSVEQARAGYGMAMMVYGLGGFIGPPLAALFLQRFELQVLFTICGIIFAVTSVLGMATALLKRDFVLIMDKDHKETDFESCECDSHESEADLEFTKEYSRFVDIELAKKCSRFVDIELAKECSRFVDIELANECSRFIDSTHGDKNWDSTLQLP